MDARQALGRINAHLKATQERNLKASSERFHRTNADAKAALAEISRKLAARQGAGR